MGNSVAGIPIDVEEGTETLPNSRSSSERPRSNRAHDKEKSPMLQTKQGVPGCTSRLLLSISCPSREEHKLVMVVSMQHGKDNPQWQELGRTRLKLNQYSDSNCYSLRKVPLDFHFELTQTIKIDVYTAANDEDDDEDDALDAFQGSMMCLLSELCAAPDRTVSFPIEQKPSHSLFNDIRLQLDVTAEKVEYQNSSLRVKLKGEHFRHVLGPQGKEKYYVCVCRTHARQGEISKERAQKLIIHSTEAISFARKSSLPDGPPPSWRSFEVNMLDLCDGDVLQSIIVEIWMQNTGSGQPHLVGEICTTVQDLLKAKASATLPVPGSGSLPAKLVLQSARMITRPTFLDFIHGGCQLSLLTAIDFTAYNGPSEDPDSLHFCGPGHSPLTAYQAAIKAITTTLAPYTSGYFPVFGFGAKPKESGKDVPTSHGFACSGSLRQAEVLGVNGVLGVYKSCLERMTFSKPRRFAQIIAEAGRHASEFHKALDQKYVVLLLLTNGVSEDMDQTIGEIIRASSLPLSILIVGIGGADFEPLKNALRITNCTYDSHGMVEAKKNYCMTRSPLKNARTMATRDMVRLATYRDVLQRLHSTSNSYSSSANVHELLAQNLLLELPRQICSYFSCHNIQPRAPQMRSPRIPPISQS